MATTAKTPKSSKRKQLSTKVVREVYGRAAGRCQLCTKDVLCSEGLGFYTLNMGELAHIVGQSLDGRSPRSDFDLPKEQRDEAENLMLLCTSCHDTIDDSGPADDFKVAWLRARKTGSEAHIRHVTGLVHHQRTCILRLVGCIRESIVQVPISECNRATLYHSTPRFAHYPLAYNQQEVEINLVPLGEPEADPEHYWSDAQRRIRPQLERIREGAEKGDITHLSVFAFARIPLLVSLGFALGSKVATELFQRHHVVDDHWQWRPNTSASSFTWSTMQAGTNRANVALVLNVSGSIQHEELPPHIDETYYVFVIQPEDDDPHRDLVQSEANLAAFRQCYHKWLAQLEVRHKAATNVHVFAAIPAAVAIACGQDLMPHVHPTLTVYDRQPRLFKVALTVNE